MAEGVLALQPADVICGRPFRTEAGLGQIGPRLMQPVGGTVHAAILGSSQP